MSKPSTTPLVIDGSQGEGGGQILRSSLSLSVLRQLPIRIENIRAKRRKPGFLPQHLAGAVALGELSGATLEGASVGSSLLEFAPKHGCGGDHTIDIRTAGATSLLFHALFYPIAYGNEGGTLTLCGGTHADRAPTFDYLQYVWAPLLRAFGIEVELQIQRHGFYPKGRGQIRASIPGNQRSHGVEWLKRPSIDALTIHSLFAEPSNRKRSKKEDIVQRMQESAFQALNAECSQIPIETVTHTPDSLSIGAVCSVFCHFGPLRAGFTAFGERGVPAERVGVQAAQLALHFLETSCTLEEHASDQVLLPLALASTPSTFTTPSLSGHLETNAWILQRFLPKLRIEFETTSQGVIVHIDPNGRN